MGGILTTTGFLSFKHDGSHLSKNHWFGKCWARIKGKQGDREQEVSANFTDLQSFWETADYERHKVAYSLLMWHNEAQRCPLEVRRDKHSGDVRTG